MLASGKNKDESQGPKEDLSEPLLETQKILIANISKDIKEFKDSTNAMISEFKTDVFT